jgi:hypothetical protein
MEGIPPVGDPGPGGPAPHVVEGEHNGEGHWGCGLFASADYLLIRPRRNAQDFAVVSPVQGDIAQGSIESVGWETRSAFRVSLGYQLPDEAWRLSATYTNLYSAGNASVTAPAGGQAFATLTRGGSIDDVDSATAFTSLNYNVVDLDATRSFCLGKGLDVQVFGGARLAWIDQKLRATYNGGSAGAQNDVVSSPVYFASGGLTGGVGGFWRVWHDLGFYSKARLSLLSGRFRNFLSETNGNGAVTIVNVHEQFYEVVPVAELSAGLGWQSEHLSLSVGYELANWFNMVDSPDFATGLNIGKVSRRTSDLTLEGLAVSLGILF